VRKFTLTEDAFGELQALLNYGIETFGVHQTSRYLKGLEKVLAMLAEQPRLGRLARHLRGGLRRYEYGAHVIFYKIDDSGIVVAAIRHRGRLPEGL
jgi:toxin ParE1/3/4